jgi:hypothetical protein
MPLKQRLIRVFREKGTFVERDCPKKKSADAKSRAADFGVGLPILLGFVEDSISIKLLNLEKI